MLQKDFTEKRSVAFTLCHFIYNLNGSIEEVCILNELKATGLNKYIYTDKYNNFKKVVGEEVFFSSPVAA